MLHIFVKLLSSTTKIFYQTTNQRSLETTFVGIVKKKGLAKVVIFVHIEREGLL